MLVRAAHRDWLTAAKRKRPTLTLHGKQPFEEDARGPSLKVRKQAADKKKARKARVGRVPRQVCAARRHQPAGGSDPRRASRRLRWWSAAGRQSIGFTPGPRRRNVAIGLVLIVASSADYLWK